MTELTEQELLVYQEPLYKAMTRPAMVFGVPMTPFIAACGFFFLIFVWTQNFLALTFLLPVIYIMRLMAKKDSLIFRLFGLKLRFAILNPRNKSFFGAKTFGATNYEKRNLIKFDVPNIKILAANNKEFLNKVTDFSPIPSFEKFIPYEISVKNVVITRDFQFIATYELEGVEFELEDTLAITASKQMLQGFFQEFLGSKCSFYMHNIRRSASEILKGSFDVKYAAELNQNYFEKINKEALRENRLYLTLIYAPFDRVKVSSFQKASAKKALEQRDMQIKKELVEIRNICEKIENGLSLFKPKRLGDYEKDGIVYNSQLEFFSTLLNCENYPVRKQNVAIYYYLKGYLNTIQFSQNIGLLDLNNGKKKFFKVIEFQNYPNFTNAEILDILLYSKVDYIITHSFTPMHSIDAKDAIKKQASRLQSGEDDAISQIADLELAAEEITNGTLGFGGYHFTITIFADSKEEVNKNVELINTNLISQGFAASQANIALSASYFAALPANFAYRPRLHTISTANLASLVSFHNFSKGKRDKNAWGDAVTMFRTPNGTPYFTNFHAVDFDNNNFGKTDTLANTLIIGQSGTGKTMLMNLLLAQLLKYKDKTTFPNDIDESKKKLTIFYLDKDKGALGNVLCLNGKYISVTNNDLNFTNTDTSSQKSLKGTGFNPFMVDNTPENILALKTLMVFLIGRELSPKEEEKLVRQIENLMSLDKELRKHPITSIYNVLSSRDETDNIKIRLKKWTRCENGELGFVFDNESDMFNFDDDDINVYGIDGTEFLENKEISSPVAFYILWRLFSVCDGRRFACFIDEAWSYLQNDIIIKFVKDKLKTIRKLNGFLVLGTQSIEDFADSKEAPTLFQQTATNILLSNNKANKDYYINKLNIRDELVDFVKTTPPSKREFIISQSNHKAIASMNLSFLDKKFLKILSTDKAFVESLENIQNKNLPYENMLDEIYKLYGESK